MDTIAVAPIALPKNEAQAPRDTKDEGNSKGAGFDQALKKELSLLKPDADTPADAPASEPAADAITAKRDDTASPNGEGIVDPAFAALAVDPAIATPAVDPTIATPAVDAAIAARLADPAQQPQNAVGLAQAAAAAAAGASATRDAADSRTGRSEGAALAGVEAAAVQRTAPERNGVEHGKTERDAPRRITDARGTGGRDASEIAEARQARESDDATLKGRDPIASDGPPETKFPGLGGEHGAAPLTAAQPRSAGVPVDALASASMMAKWPSGAQAAFDGAPAPATARIDTPLGASGWGDAFQQKIVWLVDRQQQSAELHINPPHLGPVDVMLNLTDDGTRIAFCSPHAAVREAIEANLRELRDALQARGITLGEAMVSADSGAAREQFSQDANAAGHGSGRHARGAPLTALDVPPRTLLVQRGLVDVFA